MGWAQYLFSFRGRLNRGPYWRSILVALAFIPVGILLATPYMVIEHPDASASNHSVSPLGMITIVAEGLLVVAYLVFALAVTVKRLHDRNMSAWWLVPFVFGPNLLHPAINSDIHNRLGAPPILQLLVSLLVLGTSIWAFVELGCLRGTVGENRYGPDPLGGSP